MAEFIVGKSVSVLIPRSIIETIWIFGSQCFYQVVFPF